MTTSTFKKADYFINCKIELKVNGESVTKKFGKTGIALSLDRSVDKVIIQHIENGGSIDDLNISFEARSADGGSQDQGALELVLAK